MAVSSKRNSKWAENAQEVCLYDGAQDEALEEQIQTISQPTDIANAYDVYGPQLLAPHLQVGKALPRSSMRFR